MTVIFDIPSWGLFVAIGYFMYHSSPLKKRPRVALLIETSSAHSRRVLQGVGDYMRKTVPWSVQFEPRGAVSHLPDWLATWDGDGIIARISEETARPIYEAGIPMVNLYADYPLPLVSAPVLNDQHAIGRLAAEHLLAKHFQHFGFLGQPGMRWSQQRCDGFVERILQEEKQRAAGQPLSLSVCFADEDDRPLSSWTQEREKIGQWLARLPRPVGVLAANDYRAVQLLNVCREMEMPVPEQVAVLGVDNEDIACDLAFPTLSSVIPDHVRIGFVAAELLDLRMRRGVSSDVEEESILVEPLGVAERKSTETMAVDDAIVATALAFIRERANEGINVQSVLDHMAISRCNLQKRFRRSLNRTIHEVISSTRVETIRSLLRSTDLSLEQIADRTGFRYLEYLHRFFKRETGETLVAYRKSL